MTTEYQRFLNNTKYRVLIVGLTGGSVSAVMQNDLAIAGGNDFTTAGDIVRELPIAGKIQQIKDKGTGAVKVTGRSVVSQFETRLVWNNSLKPNFNIEMTFYQDNANDADSVLAQYQRIKSAVLPTQQGSFFKAPLGYKIGNLSLEPLKPTGTLSIEIGEWFRATNMVMTAESFVLSKEVNSKGQPLFATGSVTLEPFKGLTYKEFTDYFIN